MEISDKLHVESADAAELQDLIATHFPFSYHEIQDDSVWYGKTQDDKAIELRSEDGKSIRVFEGPTLVRAHLNALIKDVELILLGPSQRVIAQAVMFGRVPVKGSWRYGDRLQILPLPAGAPRPTAEVADHHPFLVETSFLSCENALINVHRRGRAVWEASLLLGALLQPPSFVPDNHSRMHWVLHPTVDANDLVTEYAQEWYSFDGLTGVSEAFTDRSVFPALRIESGDAYYTRQISSVGEDLTIPDSLESCLDAFYALNPLERIRVLRACYWYRHAEIIRTYSRSASLESLVHCVECLMPEHESAPDCPACKKSTGKGPTARFKEFVEQLVPWPDSERGRAELYRMRSAIVHGGRLLPTDGRQFGYLDPKIHEEWDLSDNAWFIARCALVKSLAPTMVLGSRPPKKGRMFSVRVNP